MKKILIIISFIIISTLSMARDINIKVSEQSINSLLTAIGPIKNQKEIKILNQKTMLKYTIKDVQITLKKGKIEAIGNLVGNLNGSVITASINGELKPIVDNKTNNLNLKVDKLNIVGLEFLQLDKVIKKDLDIPLHISDLKPIEVKVDGDKTKKIYPKITNENIIITNESITVLGDVSFFSTK